MKFFVLTFFIFCAQAQAANFQLYLFNKTTGTYMVDDIDSVTLQSKTQRMNFVNLKKSSDRNSVIISDIPQDIYEVIVYRLYYPDKTIHGVDLNRKFFKSTINFTEAEKLAPSKASFPGGKEAFYCFIKKNANSSIIKSDSDLFDVCFSIDSLGNAKSHLFTDNKSNKVTEEINRILTTAPKWTPSMLKGKGFYYTFCCANWWTDCKTCP